MHTEPIGPGGLHIPLFNKKSDHCNIIYKYVGLKYTLAGSVNHLHESHLVVNNKLFPVRVLYGRIICLNNRSPDQK